MTQYNIERKDGTSIKQATLKNTCGINFTTAQSAKNNWKEKRRHLNAAWTALAMDQVEKAAQKKTR